MNNVKVLLDFIAQFESRGNYNVVWGRIRAQHRPPIPLTQMSIAQVLAWQDSIDPLYMSEAAGKYQILEDTLRGLYPSAGMLSSAMFDEDGQDKLAVALLKRRGLDDYLAGRINAEKFANSLAKEWASLPVVSGPKKGRSYYGGDGLNKAHVNVRDFMNAINAVKRTPPATVPPTEPGWFAALIAAILRMFTKG